MELGLLWGGLSQHGACQQAVQSGEYYERTGQSVSQAIPEHAMSSLFLMMVVGPGVLQQTTRIRAQRLLFAVGIMSLRF